MRYRVPVLGLIGLLLAPGLVHATRTMPGVCDNAAPPIVSRFDFAESSSLDRPRFRIFQNIPLGARFRGVARSAGTLSVLVPAPDATGDLQGYEGRILVWTPDDPAQYLPAPYTLTVILNLTDPAGHPIHAPPSGLSYTHQGQSDIVWTKPPETPVLSASTAGNDRYLHGRPYLPDLGLYDYRARYYEPATGTFLELDPLGPVDSPNLYQAFGFDGLNVRDPFGECWLTGDNVPCSVYAREAAQTLFSPSPKAGVERAKATGKFLWHETKGAFRLGVGLMSFGLNAIKHPVQSFQAAGDALSGPSEALRTFLDHPGEVLEALPGDIQQAGYNLSVADVDEVAEHVGGGLAGVVAFEAGGRAISAMRGALAEETGALARSGLPAEGISASAPGKGAMDPALEQRLAAYKAWKGRAGIEGTPTTAQFRRFMGAHRPASAGATLYQPRSGFGEWSRAVGAVHGN
ncbi:MAG TPA: hypothetical protein ENK19_12675, partial [Acidobacteria bacterium]|nr:hypothetical protein [Acidobacteriota bacterium]